MSVCLSHGQAEIISLASKGHNLFLTGQGRTGKSTVVREIISNLQAVGKKVSVVCSRGIAGTVYDPGVASTVHSYYGLGIADLSWDQLVERSTKNSVVIERLRKCDVLIWDEASMSSQRMLELVNAIHHRLSDSQCNRPFGGKQLILVGKFLQLRPVPNDLYEGLFMYHAPIFQTAISHRYELTEVLRQNNPEFLAALKDIRVGKCSENTLEYLTSLSTPLETPPVSFSGVGPITIERQTWFKRDKKGNEVVSICQFPIVPSIAVTCHKAQGLTLSVAVVHCSSEFVPGLTYVALSRVRDPKNLQVLNFRPDNLLPPSSRVLRECSTDLGQLDEDLQCCRKSCLKCKTDFSWRRKIAMRIALFPWNFVTDQLHLILREKMTSP